MMTGSELEFALWLAVGVGGFAYVVRLQAARESDKARAQFTLGRVVEEQQKLLKERDWLADRIADHFDGLTSQAQFLAFAEQVSDERRRRRAARGDL
jgi:hypothetical protein